MPTNQSSPWGGGKPRSGCDGPATTAIKVPLGQTGSEPSSRRDRAKTPLSDATRRSLPASVWARGDAVHTWDARSHCTTVLQDAPQTGLKNSGGQSGHTEQPQIQKPTNATPADSSPSPPQCLRHHNASSLHATRRESRLTCRIRAAKVGTKRRPTPSVSAEQQLLVRGGLTTGGAPGGRSRPQQEAQGRGRNSPQQEVQGKGKSRPQQEAQGRGRSSPQQEVQGRGRSSPHQLQGKKMHITVRAVTSQISSFHLSRRRVAPCKTPAPPPVCSSTSEESVNTHSSGLKQVDEAEGEEPLDEEAMDGELENDLSDDGDSDCSSITATSSSTSITAASSIEEPMPLDPEDDREERPALVPSLFPLVPPTIYFSTADEKVELLPAEQRRLLKWKMSTVTPNVVKHTIARSHFKVTKRSHDWLGCWGHHMKSPGFKALGEHQKLNHFPGTFQIGRKDQLWRNLSKMRLRFGKQEFSFFPRTFVLPQDIKLLRKAWEDGGSRQKWIIKPPASARGIGIQVIHKWSQLPRKRPLLVQKYLHKPYLISGNKFDLRIYVYVTSYDPLRIYIFSDGLVRFASCKYSSSMKTLSNKFMHLTNYSVNKKNAEYQSNSDHKACQGHKWALKALWQYLGSQGVDTTLIWDKIRDIVIKTVIASEPYVNTLMKMHVRAPYNCHELFGFDIMLDENLKPWILEVNISPSLHSNTALDVSIKGEMIRDLLNLAGFHIPQREELLSRSCSASSSTSSLGGASRERRRGEPSADEKVKRAFYLTQRHAQQDFLSSVLDVLTPEDVRVLAASEDELSRGGAFERVFPSTSSSRYLRFFECPRYMNLLLDQWEQKHGANRAKGIALLMSPCQRGVHLGTSDPAHMWSKSSYISRCDAHRQELLSSSRSRVLVSRHSGGDTSDQDEASVCSLPVSPSPGSSLCSSPPPGPALRLLYQRFASL